MIEQPCQSQVMLSESRGANPYYNRGYGESEVLRNKENSPSFDHPILVPPFPVSFSRPQFSSLVFAPLFSLLLPPLRPDHNIELNLRLDLGRGERRNVIVVPAPTPRPLAPSSGGWLRSVGRAGAGGASTAPAFELETHKEAFTRGRGGGVSQAARRVAG